jgi:hypothetical protein
MEQESQKRKFTLDKKFLHSTEHYGTLLLPYAHLQQSLVMEYLHDVLAVQCVQFSWLSVTLQHCQLEV